jgi:hypothetical protein
LAQDTINPAPRVLAPEAGALHTPAPIRNPLTFAVTVAVAIAATRSDPPWRLSPLALGAALMRAAAALLVGMLAQEEGESIRKRREIEDWALK